MRAVIMMLNQYHQKHLEVFCINIPFGTKLRMTNVVKSELFGTCKPKHKNQANFLQLHVQKTLSIFCVSMELFNEYTRQSKQTVNIQCSVCQLRDCINEEILLSCPVLRSSYLLAPFAFQKIRVLVGNSVSFQLSKEAGKANTAACSEITFISLGLNSLTRVTSLLCNVSQISTTKSNTELFVKNVKSSVRDENQR